MLKPHRVVSMLSVAALIQGGAAVRTASESSRKVVRIPNTDSHPTPS